MFRNIFLISLLFFLLACCKEEQIKKTLPPCERKPDLSIPDYLTPDIVKSNFNPFDNSGISYRNELFYSDSWKKNGPFIIPKKNINVFINFYNNYDFSLNNLIVMNSSSVQYELPYSYQYGDFHNRFRIAGQNLTDNVYGVPCYIVYFNNGLWNQGGYVYWGGYPATPLVVGETFEVCKWVFNENGITPCQMIKKSKARITVLGANEKDVQINPDNTLIKNESSESNIVKVDSYTPEFKTNEKCQMSRTKFRINKPNYYFTLQSVIADIDNEIDEANENNNTQMSTSNLNNGSKSVFYIRSIDSKSTHYDKSLPFVSLVSDN
jgi:hypothetical protein